VDTRSLLTEPRTMIRSNQRRFGSLEREALDWLLRITAGNATASELSEFEA